MGKIEEVKNIVENNAETVRNDCGIKKKVWEDSFRKVMNTLDYLVYTVYVGCKDNSKIARNIFYIVAQDVGTLETYKKIQRRVARQS